MPAAETRLRTVLAIRPGTPTDSAIWRRCFPAREGIAKPWRSSPRGYGRGQHLDAIARFERTLALDPGFTDAYLNLGSTHAALGEFEDLELTEHKEQLRQIQPDNAALIHNIALANARLGRLDTAIAEFRRAIALDPDNAASRRELARLNRNRGQSEAPSFAR